MLYTTAAIAIRHDGASARRSLNHKRSLGQLAISASMVSDTLDQHSERDGNLDPSPKISRCICYNLAWFLPAWQTATLLAQLHGPPDKFYDMTGESQ